MGLQGMKRFAVMVALALALLPSGQLRAETLTDALIAAYRNSNILEQSRALLRATDEDVAVAVSALRPVVNFVGQANAQNRTTVTPGPVTTITDTLSATIQVTADLTLVDFGRGQLGIQAAREAVLATREALVQTEQRVLLGAVQAYLQVHSSTETVRLRQSNLRLIEQELSAARDRFEVGEITRTDVAIAEARLAASRSALAAAQGELSVARESYNLAVGQYPGALRAPPRLPQTAASLEAARGLARHNHPAIRQAQRQVTIDGLNVERALAARHGSVSAGARAQVSVQGGPGQSTTRDLGLSLTYSRPIYSGGRISALHRQAIARADAGRAGLHQTVADVEQNVGRAWAELSVARARIEASELQITAARTAYEGVREEAALGARTTLDVLNAEQELLDAQATLISAQAGRQLATYALLEAMGLMTVEHLGLGIPTYDPEAYFNTVQDAPVTTSVEGARLDRVLRRLGQD